MPKVDDVGYGECTPLKIKHLIKIVQMHLAITKAVLKRNLRLYQQCYRYIELTAGKGFIPTGEQGSPLVFLEQLESDQFNITYRADFIECNEENILNLEKAVHSEKDEYGWKGENWNFYYGKYQEIVPMLLHTRNNRELGLIFVDPSGDLPDFDVLHYIEEKRPKMEILIYLPSTNVKRIYQYTGKRLSDLLQSVGKEYWLVRNPISWDKFKWTFLLGSNTDLFGDYKTIDFYRLDSPKGDKILQKLDLTEKEQLESKQYKLFE